MNVKRSCPSRWATLSMDPVTRLSTHTTWWPIPIKRSQRWLPRNPAPPVIKTRTLYLGLKVSAYRLHVQVEIAEMFGHHAEHLPVIYCPIQVNEQIPKAGHLAHAGHQILIWESKLAQSGHAVRVVFGTTASFSARQVIEAVQSR